MTSTRTYTIAFTNRDHDDYSLMAKASNGKSRQLVGRATVTKGGVIVRTANYVAIGIAADRNEAKRMIDAHHRANNAAEYWMWIKDSLLINGVPTN